MYLSSLEMFSTECRKTKTKVFTLAIHKNTEATQWTNQNSKKLCVADRLEAREDVWEPVTIGCGFISD